MDPEAFRAESRDRWERAAAGWEATRERLQRDAAPVTDWLLDAAGLRPGPTVLEVAAGAGETGLQAAGRVAPGGRAIITDGAEAMVAAVERRAAELGLADVEVRPMEAEWLDLPAASVDALLCRWGLMLLADPEAALREWRRVLRPGGRLALAAWAAPDANPWLSRLHGLLSSVTWRRPPSPASPARSRSPTPSGWPTSCGARASTGCGSRRSTSSTAPPRWTTGGSTRPRPPRAPRTPSPGCRRPSTTRSATPSTTAYAEFADADGRVAIPARTLVATAEA